MLAFLSFLIFHDNKEALCYQQGCAKVGHVRGAPSQCAEAIGRHLAC